VTITAADLRALVKFLGTQHVITFTEGDGWFLAHPVTCRLQPGGLAACETHQAVLDTAADWDGPPVPPGDYLLDEAVDGEFEMTPLPEGPDVDGLAESLRAVLEDESVDGDDPIDTFLAGGPTHAISRSRSRGLATPDRQWVEVHVGWFTSPRATPEDILGVAAHYLGRLT
jgi:hypothetical protein